MSNDPPDAPPPGSAWDPSQPVPPDVPPPPGSGWGVPPGPQPPPSQYSFPPPSYGYTPYGSAPAGQYASFGARLGAFLLDAVITAGPFIVLGVFFLAGTFNFDSCRTVSTGNGSSTIRCTDDVVNGGLVLLGFLVFFVGGLALYYFYFVRPIARTGQTLGMKAAHIRVVDVATGQPIGTGRSWARLLMRSFVSGAICYLGFLWMLWDDRRQTWHDKIAESVVIKV